VPAFLRTEQHRNAKGLPFGGRVGDEGADLDAAGRATEIVVEREERVGFGFGVGTSQFLLHTIDSVEKCAAIDFELARAQFPVRTQEEIITKYAMLQFAESALGDKAEVRHELLLFAGHHAQATGRKIIPRDRAGETLRLRTFPETSETSPKNGSKYAAARRLPDFVLHAHAVPMTVAASVLR